MSLQEPHDEELTPLEMVRRRIHKLTDMVQGHEGRLREHTVEIRGIQHHVDAIRSTMVSKEQLEAHERTMKSALDNQSALLGDKIGYIQKGQDALQKGINWVVLLVVGAVILAVVGLVLKQP